MDSLIGALDVMGEQRERERGREGEISCLVPLRVLFFLLIKVVKTHGP